MKMLTVIISACKAVVVSFTLLACMSSTGCRGIQNASAKPSETVLLIDESVLARTQAGIVQIDALSGTRRRISWDGRSVEFECIIRKGRFEGKLGIYNPASGFFIDRPLRVVYSEYLLHVNDEADYLKHREVNQHAAVGSDGIFVGGSSLNKGDGLSIAVWQYVIDGQRLNSIQYHPSVGIEWINRSPKRDSLPPSLASRVGQAKRTHH